MPIGFIASLILHGVLLGWALLAVITTPPLTIPKPEPVEVAMISEGDLVRLKQGDREAKKLEAEGKDGPAKEPPKKEPPKPTPPPPPQAAAPPPPPPPEPPKPDPIAEAIKQAAVEPPPPKPDPPKVEPPKAEPPKPDPIGDLAAAAATEPPKPTPPKPDPPKPPPPPKQPPKPPAPPKAAATPPPAPPKKQDLASLVNDALKTTPEKSATNAPPRALIDRRATTAPVAGQKTAATAKGASAGAPEGTDNVLTADKLSMLNLLMKNNVRRCWNINAGLEGAAKLIVKVEFKLNQAGQLVGEPRVTNSGSGAQFEDAANSARRALLECQPYTNLPPDLYAGGWDFMLLTFDPGKMF